MSRFEAVMGRFPSTILDEAQQRRSNPDIHLIDRFTLLGVVTVLQGGPFRSTRTIEIARECGVPESTLYRHIPKPVVDTLADRGFAALREDFFARRHSALLDVAAQLAIDNRVDFPSAVHAWSEVYGAIANPGSLLEASLSLSPKIGQLMHDYAGMITHNLALLGIRDSIQVDEKVGWQVLLATTAYDRTGASELGEFTEFIIMKNLQNAAIVPDS
jgi:hypothetical protein